MSHFTVLVVSDPDQNPEDQLSPFQEGDLEELDHDLLEFDVEYPFDAKQSEAGSTIDEARRIVDETSDDKSKDKLIKMLADGKYKDIVKEYGGYVEDEYGNLGYWYNPNAHWDWYQLGGRWAGMLKTKKGTKGVVGSDGLTPRKILPRHCDQALVKDIDWEGMKVDEIKKAKKWYSEAINIVEKMTRQGKPKDEAIREAEWKAGVNLKEFPSLQKYLDSVTKKGFRTFAFISPDGEWFEEGDMGWFGCVGNRDIKKYDTAFKRFVKNLKPDQTLSIYDCHI